MGTREIDPDLAQSCMGMGLQFHQLWDTAERYVRRGDDFHQSAGMRILADFAQEVPLEAAASLIEWHFAEADYYPVYGPKPVIDAEAFRAAVAVGLAEDFFELEGSSARRRRMIAVVAQSLAVVTDPSDRGVVQRAFRALIQRDANSYVRGSTWHDGLIRGRKFDHELVSRCSGAFEDGRLDDALRAAMVVLEERLRTSSSAPLDLVGTNLAAHVMDVKKDFNFGATAGEREGLLNIFRSTFLLFRNPPAHRFTDEDEERALQILTLVDLLLGLVAEANTRLYDPVKHLSPAEAGRRVRVERVLHVDLDGDSVDETVLVYSILDGNGNESLHPLFLKVGDSGWCRVRIEPSNTKWETSRFTRLAELTEVELGGQQKKRVLLRADNGADQGGLQLFELSDGVIKALGFEPYIALYRGPDLGVSGRFEFALADGVPVFRDADGDGLLELHLRQTHSGSAPNSTLKLDLVYKFDEAASRFRLARKSLAPGQ